MSDTLTKIEINCTTGEVTEIPLTAEEISQREVDAIASSERLAEQAVAEAAHAAAKASAEAKLSALGLTPEEIAALR